MIENLNNFIVFVGGNVVETGNGKLELAVAVTEENVFFGVPVPCPTGFRRAGRGVVAYERNQRQT